MAIKRVVSEFLEKLGFYHEDETNEWWSNKEIGGPLFYVKFKNTHCEIYSPISLDEDVITYNVIQAFKNTDQFYVYKFCYNGVRIWNSKLDIDEIRNSKLMKDLVNRATERGTSVSEEFCRHLDRIIQELESENPQLRREYEKDDQNS